MKQRTAKRLKAGKLVMARQKGTPRAVVDRSPGGAKVMSNKNGEQPKSVRRNYGDAGSLRPAPRPAPPPPVPQPSPTPPRSRSADER